MGLAALGMDAGAGMFGFIYSQYGRRKWMIIILAYTLEFGFEPISLGPCVDAQSGG
jgi:hypothetical protein